MGTKVSLNNTKKTRTSFVDVSLTASSEQQITGCGMFNIGITSVDKVVNFWTYTYTFLVRV